MSYGNRLPDKQVDAPWTRTRLQCEHAQQCHARVERDWTVTEHRLQSFRALLLHSADFRSCYGWAVTHGHRAPRLLERGKSFAGVEWTDADLRTADFAMSDFSDAKLTDCDLRGVNFTGTKLSGATFVRCDLSGAFFHGAQSAGSTWRGCRFLGADLSRSGIAAIVDLDCDLTGADTYDGEQHDERSRDPR